MVRRRGDKGDRRGQERRSGKKSRFGWFSKLFILSLLLLVGLVIAAPTLLGSASMVNWAIAKYGGLGPLRAQVSEVQLGWFQPVGLKGFQLVDQSGQALAKVDSISTEKGLLSWITNQSDLGSIRIDGTEAAIEASNGTTNIEQALSSLLSGSPKESSGSKSTSKLPTGKIEITNTKLLLSETGRAERWVVEVPMLKTDLPTASQLFGPTEIQARITETSGAVQGKPGEIVVAASQNDDGTIQLQAKLSDLPLDIVRVARARLPELPIQDATGRVTGVLSGSAVNADQFAFDLQQLQASNIAILAPSLVGATPARLANVMATGKVSLANNLMKIQNTDLACDFARVQATADIPWPMQTPTATNPFLAGATINASGVVDLPKMVTAAQSLVPMRPDTQLMGGKLQFAFQQTSAQQPLLQAKVQLSGLQATSAGQNISWNDPVTLDLSAQSQPSGPQFGIGASAEFCKLQGKGTIQNGSLEGNVDLELLHRRLSQFVTLPISAMNGSAQVNLNWSMDANQLVSGQGGLQTAQVNIVTPTGARMSEPAWKGQFASAIQLREGTPTAINQLRLEMIAAEEQLYLELNEPMQLAATPNPKPAGFKFSMTGNLANLKHRAFVWLSQPPEMQVDGVVKLDVVGRVDTTHAEVQQANWDIQPLRLNVADMAFAEPQVVGNFKGNVNTNDLTKLAIEQLTIQASSFSLLAKDQAGENNSRRGQANCIVSLQRLLKNSNVMAGPGSLASTGNDRARMVQPSFGQSPSATTPPTSYSASGDIQAGLAWAVNAAGAEFRIQANGKDIVLISQTVGSPAMPLWSESQLLASADGRWTASSGAVSMEPMQLQTPWLNYQGKLNYAPSEKAQDLTMNGQAVYDAQQLSEKIGPMTGNNVQMIGQHTMPIEVSWHRDSSDTKTPALAGLRASSRIGWQQARVVGIEVGKADVPVNIDAGKLTTAAEIPVSGGMLRWDIFSDLTQETIVLQQKPMTVLENVAITREMCSGWLKYVAPLVADATSIEGKLSMQIRRAEFVPTNLAKQTVEGNLVMHKVEVGPGPLSNEVIGIAKQIEQIRKADLTQSGSSPSKAWATLPEQNISFTMVDGRVHHRDLKVDVGDATIMTAGSVAVDGQLEMLASMPIPDKWTEKSQIMGALKGQSLQFPVRGTISRPQVDASMLGQLGRQTIMNAGQNVIQQQLNKGLDKLFK
ncbi:MAG: hypothetical protein U0930_09745 [Pirellulales bacterium]